MALKLSILGCNSAIPTIDRFTTSQVLSTEAKSYVIDFGEGMQIRLNQLKIKKNKIHEVFISHLHGDHFFGLPGFLTSLNLSGRTLPIKIYGPKGLIKFIETLKEIGSFYLNFELDIVELQDVYYQKIHEDKEIEVYSFPLKHRIPTTGFLFKEKEKDRKIKIESIQAFQLSFDEIKQLKSANDVLRPDQTIISYKDHTIKNEDLKSFAFCSDTIYDESLLEYISGVDLLYHEATYLDELKDKARERMHASSIEAATIAKKAGVKKLILGHYSSRYKDTNQFKEEASHIFPNTELAADKIEFII